jgi:hypothetical protein
MRTANGIRATAGLRAVRGTRMASALPTFAAGDRDLVFVEVALLGTSVAEPTVAEALHLGIVLDPTPWVFPPSLAFVAVDHGLQ